MSYVGNPCYNWEFRVLRQNFVLALGIPYCRSEFEVFSWNPSFYPEFRVVSPNSKFQSSGLYLGNNKRYRSWSWSRLRQIHSQKRRYKFQSFRKKFLAELEVSQKTSGLYIGNHKSYRPRVWSRLRSKAGI